MIWLQSNYLGEPPELPAAKAKLTAYKDDPSETFERKIPPEYNCQDLFELSQLVTNSSETSQKDSKTDIMNLLEKVFVARYFGKPQ